MKHSSAQFANASLMSDYIIKINLWLFLRVYHHTYSPHLSTQIINLLMSYLVKVT
jgi:hypothetical protein